MRSGRPRVENFDENWKVRDKNAQPTRSEKKTKAESRQTAEQGKTRTLGTSLESKLRLSVCARRVPAVQRFVTLKLWESLEQFLTSHPSWHSESPILTLAMPFRNRYIEFRLKHATRVRTRVRTRSIAYDFLAEDYEASCNTDVRPYFGFSLTQ